MPDCNHDCGSCGENCGERSVNQKSPMNKNSNVKKVIGVISGKGGVGKSSVTSMLAVAARRMGKNVAIMDADLTGPSIPKAFNVHEQPMAQEDQIIPCPSKTGIEIMSTNLLLADETDPVIWRGPLLQGVIEQFWSDVIWGDVDVMFVDMPPGTGDVALSVYQQLPVDGVVIVTSPQELVEMIVEKAVKMAGMMNIPVLGIVENMSYFKCPDCGGIHKIFGESNIEATAKKHGIPLIAKLPIDPKLAEACDNGTVEDYDSKEIAQLAEDLLK